MHIDSYQFGKIIINGSVYDNDIKIIHGVVHPNWWRKQGHSLLPEDIEDILQASPSVLIIGCGASAMMDVPDETQKILKKHNIRFEILDTAKAVHRLNELSKGCENLAAALHLTC
ncbi:MAG: MTH938/NDUFAF3 family protein [Sedimentisphaerales bacterium]